MAVILSKTKCPQCAQKTLTVIGQMVRCTCGWWGHSDDIDEEVPQQPVKIAQALST
jgi:hypothetical protein